MKKFMGSPLEKYSPMECVVSLSAAQKRTVDQNTLQDDGFEEVISRRNTRAEELQSQVAQLLEKMKIAVIYGGDKEEDGSVIHQSHNPRSWKSYETVARDIANSLVRLGGKNIFILPDDMRLSSKLAEREIDFAWLNTGGVQGFASISHAASLLEMLGLPYVGHDPLNSAIMDSKHSFKRQMMGSGIPTARFVTWHGSEGKFDPKEHVRFNSIFYGYNGPFVVKPVSGRASLNVEYVETREELSDVMDHIFDLTQNFVLVEQFLGGREYCVAACGPVVVQGGDVKMLDAPFTFAAIERALDPGEHIFTSMDKKPITSDRIRLLDPSTDVQVIRRLHNLARSVMTELDINTLIRLDVREDDTGQLYVLESNPKPDLKAPTKDGVISIISAGLQQYGMTYDDLIHSLLADRIDILMSRHRGSIHHLLSLIENN